MGYEMEAYLYYFFSLYWKKRFSREHTKNPNANARARPDVTFGLWDIIPPRVPASFSHILCKM